MKSQLLYFLVIIFAATASDAASPRDELFRLVPKDAGFVIVMQDLRGHSDRVRQSPFVKLVTATLPARAANAPELRQLAELDDILKREVGTSLSQLRDDVLGDAVVFVWRPGPPDKPDAEAGVVLVRPRDATLAANIFKHVDTAQTKSGQLKEAASRTHAGQTYKRRVRTDEPDEYQYQRGNLLAFGSSESMLKQVIEADISNEKTEPPMADKLRSLNVDGAAVVWWMNPRAFDAALAHKQTTMTGPDAAMVNAVAKHWQAMDGIAGYMYLGEDIRIGVAMSARTDALPTSTRRFFSEAARPSSLLQSFPTDAMLTISGRFSLSPIIDAGSEFLPSDAQQRLRDATVKTVGTALGPDATLALPTRLGPDWGVCVTLPPADSKSAMPVITAAVRLDDDGTGPAVAPRVVDGINALATFAAIGYNSNHTESIALRNERIGDIDVRYLVGDAALPNGVRPAFAWKKGYLVFASTPEAVANFRVPEPGNANGPAPVLRIAPKACVNYLQMHKSVVSAMVATKAKSNANDVVPFIDGAISALKLFESVEVSVRTETDKSWIELKIVPVAALR